MNSLTDKYIYIMIGDRYIKTKIWTYGAKFYTDFCSFNVPEDVAESESLKVISIVSLLAGNKYYLQLHLGNCISKIVNTQIL